MASATSIQINMKGNDFLNVTKILTINSIHIHIHVHTQVVCHVNSAVFIKRGPTIDCLPVLGLQSI